MEDLTEKWLSLELHHRTSKTATEEFWALARSAFPKLYQAKIDEMVYKPIPKFRSQRRKFDQANTPEVKIETAFRNKENDDVSVIEGTKAPTGFSPNRFQKLYEVATVQVNRQTIFLSILFKNTSTNFKNIPCFFLNSEFQLSMTTSFFNEAYIHTHTQIKKLMQNS